MARALALSLVTFAASLAVVLMGCGDGGDTGGDGGKPDEPQVGGDTWEDSVVTAWTEQKDCKAGMCPACGYGAAIVELGADNATAVRTLAWAAPWDADSTLEIASVTKIFTSLTAIILEDEGVVSLNEAKLQDLLPCDWESAVGPVASISLMELMTHMSGLPAQPPNRQPAVGGNPFYMYSEQMLCDSLLKISNLPTRQIAYSYSNYAYGILGYVLTRAVAAQGGGPAPSYEELVKEKILVPLGMTSTSVTYDDAGWKKAADGCSRGLSRGENTIRTGGYDVLQGNGALRSTLNDMGKFLSMALMVDAEVPLPADATAASQKLYTAFARGHSVKGNACSCVSGWCEGILCNSPNSYDEKITLGGFERYSSGNQFSWRKSGDTGGYSLRVAWSAAKRRAALSIDTCGGCAEHGTSGSAAQRAALLLADGPPLPTDSVGEVQALDAKGTTMSYIYPSTADMQLTVAVSGGEATVRVASSDGTGGAAIAGNATADGGCILGEPVLYGAGYQADKDPLTKVSQRRSVRRAEDGRILFQDMGADVVLTAALASDQGQGAASLGVMV